MYVWLKLLNFIETCEEKCDENSYCLNGRCYCLPGYKHDPVTKRCYHSKGKRGLRDFELNWNSKVQIFMDREMQKKILTARLLTTSLNKLGHRWNALALTTKTSLPPT